MKSMHLSSIEKACIAAYHSCTDPYIQNEGYFWMHKENAISLYTCERS